MTIYKSATNEADSRRSLRQPRVVQISANSLSHLICIPKTLEIPRQTHTYIMLTRPLASKPARSKKSSASTCVCALGTYICKHILT